MQQPLPEVSRPVAAPSFALIGRQPLGPGTILLAIALAFAAIYGLRYGLEHARHARAASEKDTSRASSVPSAASKAEDDDDPNQIDTIVLGDPADAPRPGRHGDHVSPVHPTIVVRLPRYGDDTGMIPASPAGHLLFDWLAAFNQSSPSALTALLPPSTTEAQLALRHQTRGFALISAREVEPGILVFRLRDQTPAATEVLGSLQMVPGSTPPAIATFSLRAVLPQNASEPKTQN